MVTVTHELPPLAALVKRKLDEGSSYRDMERRARSRGYVISHAQLQSYATNAVKKAPSPEQIEAIAAAIGTSPERVQHAMFAQYYGYVPNELARLGPETAVSAAVPEDLTPEEEAELARLVQAWVAARRADDVTGG